MPIIPTVVTPGSGGAQVTPGGGFLPTSKSVFGTFQRPFSARSPFNSRPVNPKLSAAGVLTSIYRPTIGPGKFSTGAFEATRNDPPITIYADPKTGYIRDVDGEQDKKSITLPRWPAAAKPATGGDGHCDVYDSVTGMVHSFWQLHQQANGQWTAVLYAWTRIDGTGWGDPAHYYQGARAAAVAPIGGLIRIHEANDGKPNYDHALAMSLTFNTLCPNPAYVYPATSADQYAANLNKGLIPEGALVMLPASFDVNTITNERLRKVAATLKLYGAYVVDQNEGTPYSIYVENETNFSLYGNGWRADQQVDLELEMVRAALRMVGSVGSWLDGDGKPYAAGPDLSQNLLSMRGIWQNVNGPTQPRPVFDTWRQALVFPPTASVIEAQDANGRGLSKVAWACAAPGRTFLPGQRMRFTAIATGGATIRMQIWVGVRIVAESPFLRNGESYDLTWVDGGYINYIVRSGIGGESTVSATIIRL